ncbi:2-oxoglutarate dehydrogenase complex dihydrolipoyllysine-residue succinyltransferase [Roseospirillum parvum]|uniref:Dihydrolipoyllysine-residue succinyltransferase component of 2-oxoglutarate dehydrogenase complex n=1 Tax=Roseospirillum parvum TaxID=83401 RepID=A0A1G8AU87_9PROT|nr:2-oxoglutarate dehydrogenase complex dihydrolipoyllysine-residue succinyltransferase [Roseospirillum parvum]SDH24519.1 2-oxoglutarate dehydrogenase E2 component (dihydrolipoamide succinyltransferase) [Roseospirillum parvum]
MAIEIKVPQLGESVSEATVAKWFKQAGEAVAADEPIAELETDKVTVEVPAPVAGVLSEIIAEEGAEVEVGSLLARLEEGAEASPGAKAPAKDDGAKSEPAKSARAEDKAAAPADSDRRLAPAVRKLVEENSLDPATIPATGKDGRLTKEDVVRYLKGGAPPAPEAPQSAPKAAEKPAPRPTPASPARGGEERVKMSRLRRRVAERLKEAQNTAAMLTTFNEVDMGALMDLRGRYKDSFEKKHGVRLGFMSFFIKAAVAALKDIPAVNAEIDGDEIVYKNHYDISVAVGGPQGLVVPVLRDADMKSYAELEAEIAEFGRKAREGRLSIEEMTGGTFTISNGGVYGSLMSTPILNPPQSGILGMHKVQQRPMVMPNGAIEARPMMYLALSYDHRIVDGKEAVTFLVRIKEAIEDPARLMIGV